MDMQNYTTPFAIDGDREEFSIDTDPSGKVSLKKGWTELYQLRPEEGGLFILRRVFNQMMKLVSTDTVTWKTQSFPNWIDDKGDGLPFAYPKNALVKYTNGNIYVSLVGNNTQVPTGANWKLFDITALDNTVELTGNQTIAGVKTFSSSPIVPTPIAGTQAVNKDYADLKVALTQFTGANQSLSENGYQKLPGGLIIQWGTTTGTGWKIFPVAFTTAVVSLIGEQNGNNTTANLGIVEKNTTSFNMDPFIDAGTYNWFAIGY